MSLLDHLKSRGIDPEKTRVIVDEESGMATFLLFNLSGQLVGHQRYNPNGSKSVRGNFDWARYYTHVAAEGDRKKIAVWGLESLSVDDPFVFVTEGIFDANKVQNAGYPAIAVLTNHPVALRSWFRALGKRIIAITDADEAGRKLAALADESHVVPPPHKDLGEMPQPDVDAFIDSIVNGASSSR